jgi:hypothetical protein
MLDSRAADKGHVVHRIIVLTSWVCCALVAISFMLFALHEVSGASAHQVNAINVGPSYTATGEPVATSTSAQTPAAPPPAQPKRFIDGAAKLLTTPFSTIVASDNQWVLHGLPTLFALLAYGLGLGYVARFTRGLT